MKSRFVLLTMAVLLALSLFARVADTPNKVEPVKMPVVTNEETSTEVTGKVTLRNTLAESFKVVGKGYNYRNVSNSSINIGTGYHFTAAKGPVLPENLRIKEDKGDFNYYIVQFTGPIKEEWKDDVRAIGGRFEEYIPNFAFIVKLPNNKIDEVRNLPEVQYVGYYEPAYKLHVLVRKALDAKAVSNQKLVVVLHQDADLNTVVDRVKSLGIKVSEIMESPYQKGFVVDIPSDLIDDLAQMTEIKYMEPRVRVYPLNDMSHSMTQMGSTDVGDTTVWRHGIRGEGELINVTDSGITTGHWAFYDPAYTIDDWGEYPDHRKVISYKPTVWDWIDDPSNPADSGITFGDESNNDYHGTHTSCSTSGLDDPNGGTSNYDGMAKYAKIVFRDCGGDEATWLWIPWEPYEMHDSIYNEPAANGQKVLISSNSYGSSSLAGNYTTSSHSLDAFVWDHKDYNLFFSAGNEGSNANTISFDASAKNVYAVGASYNDYVDGLASFSSRGPTDDGRIGVTICAPGSGTSTAYNNIVSADGSTSGAASDYVGMDGTSMACPIAAGNAALVRDYLKQGFYPGGSAVPENAILNPSAALIKAMMVASAQDFAGYTAPDPNIGFGRIQLDKVMFFADSGKVALALDDEKTGLMTGEYKEYQFNVSTSQDTLKVVLAWNDYPAFYVCDTDTVNPTPTLVNDLDLVVLSPSGTRYYPNKLTSEDRLNPIEMVRVPDAETGIWTIRVEGYNVPVGPQPYGLVITSTIADQNAGLVKLNKPVYAPEDTVTITVDDINVEATSFDVMVYSKIIGDTEIVTLTGVSGEYTGILPLDGGLLGVPADSVDDGVLVVDQADTIVAIYNDLNPSATVTAFAPIDGIAFTISDVRAKDISAYNAKITWVTSDAANGKVYYSTDKVNWNESYTETNMVTDHSGDNAISLSGLEPETVYYYYVVSQDARGNTVIDNNGGEYYSFTTGQVSGVDILVIVTNDNPEGEIFAHPEFLIDAINEGGWTYVWWYTPDHDGQIPTSFLKDFKAVFLQAGQENYPELTKEQEDSLDAYLLGGGRISFTGHDFGWAMQSSEGFSYIGTDQEDSIWIMQHLCGIYHYDLVDVGDFTIYGVTTDEISQDFAASGVPYNPFRSGADGDLIYYDSGVSTFAPGLNSPVWNWNAPYTTGDTLICGIKFETTDPQGTLGDGVWGGYTSRTVWNAFEITQIDTTDPNSTIRPQVLNNLFIWLIGHDHPDVAISSPVSGNTYTTSPITIDWTQSAYGGASIDSVWVEYSPDSGLTYYPIAVGTAAEVTSPVSWDISSIPNGTKYMIRVRVKDTGVYPALGGYDVIGPITLDRPDGDLIGPAVTAGSIVFDHNPAGNIADSIPSPTVTITAIVSDAERGDNNIAAAEYSIGDAPAAAGTGIPMVAADGTFDSVEETVTGTINTEGWAAGQYKVWVRAMDASPAKTANNWGSASYATLNVVDVGLYMTLTNFSAIPVDKGVEVRWTTVKEDGTAKFIIMRSTSKDGEYESVAEVTAAGISKGERNYSIIDENVENGKVYYYKLVDISVDGTRTEHPAVKVVAGGWARPTMFALYQNTPNPFKDATTIRYAVPRDAHVELKIYSVTGRLVKTLVDDEVSAGYYTVKWDGKDNNGNKVAQGVYFYKMKAGDFSSMKRLMFIK